jgi:hypothetical protein
VNHVEVIQLVLSQKIYFSQRWDYIFFYRKRSRGKIVAQAAAEHLLRNRLGGKIRVLLMKLLI